MANNIPSRAKGFQIQNLKFLIEQGASYEDISAAAQGLELNRGEFEILKPYAMFGYRDRYDLEKSNAVLELLETRVRKDEV